MRITVAMMMDPAKHGLEECKHCHGYGSSLKESARTCSRCDGSGLVAVGSQVPVQSLETDGTEVAL